MLTPIGTLLPGAYTSHSRANFRENLIFEISFLPPLSNKPSPPYGSQFDTTLDYFHQERLAPSYFIWRALPLKRISQ